jgi:hypothetical protein
MPNNPHYGHASVPQYDLDGFPIRTGSAADIRLLVEADWPPINQGSFDGWVMLDVIGSADPDDLAAIIGAADKLVLSRGVIDADEIVLATKLAACGTKVALIELFEDEPIPVTVVEAIAQSAATQQ